MGRIPRRPKAVLVSRTAMGHSKLPCQRIWTRDRITANATTNYWSTSNAHTERLGMASIDQCLAVAPSNTISLICYAEQCSTFIRSIGLKQPFRDCVVGRDIFYFDKIFF